MPITSGDRNYWPQHPYLNHHENRRYFPVIDGSQEPYDLIYSPFNYHDNPLNMAANTVERGLGFTTLLRWASLSSLLKLSRSAASLSSLHGVQKSVNTTTTVFSVITITSIPYCSVDSGLAQCPNWRQRFLIKYLLKISIKLWIQKISENRNIVIIDFGHKILNTHWPVVTWTTHQITVPADQMR